MTHLALASLVVVAVALAFAYLEGRRQRRKPIEYDRYWDEWEPESDPRTLDLLAQERRGARR